MIKITVEELDIIVDASIKKATDEFSRLTPAIKKEIKKVQDFFSNVNIKDITAKIDTNNIKNQTKEIKKEIKEIFDPNDVSGIKITGLEEETKKVETYWDKVKGLNTEASSGKGYVNYNTPKQEKTKNETQDIEPSQKSLSMWDILKQKISQVKPAIEQFKQSFNSSTASKELELIKYKISEVEEKLEKAKNGKIHLNSKEILQTEAELERLNNKKTKIEGNSGGNAFSGWASKLKGAKSQLNGISGVTVKIKNQIKQMGSGMKQGLGHVLKYAGALFSLRGIYSMLSNSASSWLSSSNSQAQQLSANIEYMKYALGSALAPVIQMVTNLIYQLLKAVQSVVYAFSGINIFAKATASSMNKTAGNAKQASKSLAGVHSEINNVSENNGSGGSGASAPNMDLSQLDNTPNKILDAIKNGDWTSVGSIIGEKLNNALDNIPWESIQSKAKSIATNIAGFLNGFIGTTDWNKVGNTFAQGLNTAIYFAYSFITTFDWKQFGKAIGDSINGFFKNTDWSVAGKTFGEAIKGVINFASTALAEIDWQEIANSIISFITNIDWAGVSEAIFHGLGVALGVIVKIHIIIAEKIKEAMDLAKQYFKDKIEECGGNVVTGIFKGIIDAIVGIGQWINDNIFQPFINGFKEAFGIHSPSTVMAEMGGFLIEGLKNGLLGIWEKVKAPFVELGTNIGNKFNEIKTNVTNWAENTKTTLHNWADTAKSKVSDACNNLATTAKGKFNEMRDNISNGLNNAKNTIDTWGENVKTSFSKTISNATTWGKDLVTNMSNGIRNNIGKVTSAVNSVASKIKSLIGFSEPEDGPLSNFHTYMPDMIDLMVNGIRSNMSKVTDELENMTAEMSYTINTPDIASLSINTNAINSSEIQPRNMITESLSDILSDNESTTNISIPLAVYVGNKKVGEILLENLRDKKRQTGKNIEALVGG